MEGPQDKRGGQRTPVGLLLKLSYGTVDEFVERFASNISRGGVFIRTREPRPVGTLLAFELFPRRSRYLQVSPGLRVERDVVEEEAEQVAAGDPAVLSSVARLVPRRRRSSKLSVLLKVRRGENLREAETRVEQAMADRVAEQGQVRIARAKVKGSTRDPRGSKRRVR